MKCYKCGCETQSYVCFRKHTKLVETLTDEEYICFNCLKSIKDKLISLHPKEAKGYFRKRGKFIRACENIGKKIYCFLSKLIGKKISLKIVDFYAVICNKILDKKDKMIIKKIIKKRNVFCKEIENANSTHTNT